jgi:hypothetical protein
MKNNLTIVISLEQAQDQIKWLRKAARLAASHKGVQALALAENLTRQADGLEVRVRALLHPAPHATPASYWRD